MPFFMLMRLSRRYLLGQDSNYPGVNFNANVQGSHKTLIRQIGGASIVLLKNTNNALPLKNPASIAIIGAPSIHSLYLPRDLTSYLRE